MLICVDPTAYASAAQTFGDYLSSDIRAVASELGSDLTAMSAVSGHDPAGAAWAEAYDAVATVTVQAIEDLGRASANVGALLQQAGFNHARAEAYSDISGGAELPPDSLDYDAGAMHCYDLPSAAGGGIGDPPFGWELLREAGAFVWPDGDPAKLRQMGEAWTRAADGLDAGWPLVTSGMSALDAQDSPEIQSARGVCRTIGDGLTQLSTQCRAMATGCDELADHIESAHRELITEINLLLASIIAIEIAAGLAGAMTAGAGAVAMQAAVFGAVVATGTRIALIIARLLEMATLTGASLAWTSADAVGDGIRAVLALTPKVADAAPVATTLKALDDLANKLSKSPWPQGPSPRGFTIEAKLGGNLPPGFPTIDKWDKTTGVATSIKSVDLASKTYQSAARLKSLLTKYIDKMAAFQEAEWLGTEIVEGMVKERVLHVAVPRTATPEQQEVLSAMYEYAQSQGVQLVVEVIR